MWPGCLWNKRGKHESSHYQSNKLGRRAFTSRYVGFNIIIAMAMNSRHTQSFDLHSTHINGLGDDSHHD
jgi:hypothetical protein